MSNEYWVRRKRLNGKKEMKKIQRKKQQRVDTAGTRLTAKERKVLQASLNQVNELADRLGLFDPLDGESPMIFFAEEGKR
jgi:hypothetical protein